MVELTPSRAEAPRSSSQSTPQAGAEQVGALCWRPSLEGIEVLLITSRDTGRWVIPKGWPIEGLDAANSARQEAWEEAGVEGRLISDRALGCYDYDKLLRRRTVARRCRVEVFALRVERLAEEFPERAQRKRQWFHPAQAATCVQEGALRELFEALATAPHRLAEGDFDIDSQAG